MVKRAHFVRFGPPIDAVPITHFSKTKLTSEQFADAWRLCGPSVERNMERLEIWQVIASAYLEGLSHGHDIATERTPASGAALREPKGWEC